MPESTDHFSESPFRFDATSLSGLVWQYGRVGTPPGSEALRLEPNGTIKGYDHPNERRWSVEDGKLCFWGADESLTVRFDVVSAEPGMLVLQGRYARAPALNIQLRLEQHSPQTPRPSPPIVQIDSGMLRAAITSPAFCMNAPEVRQRHLIPPDVLGAMEATWNRREFGERTIRFTELRDVYVAKEGLVFTQQLRLIQASITQHSERDVLDARAELEMVRSGAPLQATIAGTAILAKKRGAGNYGHWLIEMLPKALLGRIHLAVPALRCIIPANDGALGKIMTATLRRTGYLPSDCITLGDAPAFVERLVIVDGLSEHGGYMSPIAVNAANMLAGASEPAPARKIYVSRQPVAHRQFIDAQAVEARARAAGYEVVNPGEMTFDDQVAAFTGADIIVGVMGAALTNIVFARPGALVINLAPANMPDTFFWFIAGHRGLHYREVRCPVDGPMRGAAAWDRDMIFPDHLVAEIFP